MYRLSLLNILIRIYGWVRVFVGTSIRVYLWAFISVLRFKKRSETNWRNERVLYGRFFSRNRRIQSLLLLSLVGNKIMKQLLPMDRWNISISLYSWRATSKLKQERYLGKTHRPETSHFKGGNVLLVFHVMWRAPTRVTREQIIESHYLLQTPPSHGPCVFVSDIVLEGLHVRTRPAWRRCCHAPVPH